MTEKQKKGNTTRTKSAGKQDALNLRIILFIVWLLAGLYFGIASWTKINYESLIEKADEARALVNCDDPNYVWYEYKDELYCVFEDIYVIQQLELMERTSLDWIFYLPNPLPFILSAFAFGALGSMVRIIRNTLGTKAFPDLRNISLTPAMGGATALMLLGASYVFPALFSDSNILLKPEVQPFLSLFAGAFSEHLQKWFQSTMEKNFSIEKEKK